MPRNAWNATWPRQPFDEPGAERLGCIVPAGADRKRNAGARSSCVQPDFALDVLLLAKRQRHASAQPGARNDAVEIVEGQLAAGESDARRQADILRQRI